MIGLVTGGVANSRALVDRVGGAARAGVHLVQVRARHLDQRSLLALVAGCLEAVRHTSTRVVVNDRLDVAIAAGAHGVHLRGDSLPPHRVRAIVPRGFLIGRSVHEVREVLEITEAGGADYFLFGTVFPSRSKPGGTPAGLDGLARAAAATPIPVLAIGGVTAEHAARVRAAGAAGFAAIALFADPAVSELAGVVSRARTAWEHGTGGR